MIVKSYFLEGFLAKQVLWGAFYLAVALNHHSSLAETIPDTISIIADRKYVKMKFEIRVCIFKQAFPY